jgi:hypothetical protein
MRTKNEEQMPDFETLDCALVHPARLTRTPNVLWILQEIRTEYFVTNVFMN